MTGVAADILTGFLGSGKTTLLKHVLEHGLDGRRVAIVMNELGDVGLDGKIITGLRSVEKMVEVTSGCICCSVGAQFGMAIREILATVKPHLIVIETTGVAEPFPLIGQVREAGLSLDAVITVVDAANAPRELRESEAARAQVEAADFLVLNKADLVGDRERRAVERKLQRLNPRALIHPTSYGEVGTDLLFGTGAGRLRRESASGAPESAGRASAHGGHLAADEIGAFNWVAESGVRLARRRFERFLERLPYEIYRAKGIVRFEEEDGAHLFHFTCGRFEVKRFPLEGDAPDSQAVFIGRDADRLEGRVLGALRRCRADLSPLERLRAALGARA